MEQNPFHKLSGAAKKKQLQIKRAQKREKRMEEAADDEAAWVPMEEGAEEDEGTHAGSAGEGGAFQQGNKGKHPDAGGAARKGRLSRGKAQQQVRGGRARTIVGGSKVGGVARSRADKEVEVAVRLQPIQYAPLVAVPLATAEEQQAMQRQQQPPLVQDRCSAETEGGAAAATRMPMCHPAEVGEVAGPGLAVIGMPKRPAWRGVVSSAQQLQELEEHTFKQWQQQLAQEWDDVSFYEPRLEFWRQLWRALEFSDIVLHVIDARNPLLHFSAALAHHVLAEHHKAMVLCLNKCDLIPQAAVRAWTQHFQQRFPGVRVVASSATAGDASALAVMQAVLVSSIERDGGPVQASEVVEASAAEVLRQSQQRNTVSRRTEPGPTARQLLLQEQEGQEQQRRRRRQQRLLPQPGGEEEDEEEDVKEAEAARSSSSSSGSESDRGNASDAGGDNLGKGPGAGGQQGADLAGRRARQSSTVVVAVVGEPNVGKSSTMNMLLGAHKVATSSHPGRTKRNQTHFMTPRLKLLDAPGLVFPRKGVSMPLQVLFGSLPIASCRDPYSVLAYLAARMWPRLHMVLGLRKVTEDGKPKLADEDMQGCAAPEHEQWTPLELCEAFAAKKNWRAHQGGRLDTFRAANWILRAALAGRSGVVLAFWPFFPQ